MAQLPIHPITGLRALGMSKRGPIWPVLGGSGEAPPDNGGAGGDAGTANNTPEAGDSGKGFPEGTPVADMTAEQQVAYWKFHARKHEGREAAYKGVTPKQVEQMQQRIKELESAALTENERAVQAAKDEAAQAARAAADAEWLPKLLRAELKAIAGTVLTDKDRLDAFMNIADPAKFATEAGEIDADKVITHLSTLSGRGQQRDFGSGVPQHQNWGQHANRPTGSSGIEQGKAAAAKRHGTKTTP
ncbi:hypothetical protein [Nocardia cyriacigeorgica]|uniref:hypothetical protein n=1 Tax=Nocardia cyriacigeorgica TaxID=135487 RepID=UPI0024544672|nr:hypothetical protein [Nocardia cyriacigeorgica]